MVVNDDICIFQEFKEDLEALLKETGENSLVKELEKMYQLYVEKDRTYFHLSCKSEVITFFAHNPEGLSKIEILATLLFQDACLQKNAVLKKDLLEKSWLLYQYVCAISYEFSVRRIQTIRDIENNLADIKT